MIVKPKKIPTCKRTSGCNEPKMKQPGHTGLYFKGCVDCEIAFSLTQHRKYNIKRKAIEKQQEAKETKDKKIDIMSADEYRAKYVQPIINEIVRLIDYGQPCIATGNPNGKMNGGHYFSVGSNRTTCLNLHNIHIQSFHSNNGTGGDNIRYRDGIIKIYGIAYMEQIEALKQLKPIKLTKDELREVKRIATDIRDMLKTDKVVRTPEERIGLREEFNWRIGIYK